MGCGESKPLPLPSTTSKPAELGEKRGEQLAPEKQPVSKPDLDDGIVSTDGVEVAALGEARA